MGGRGSALFRRAILLAIVGTTAWLSGCMEDGSPTPDERTGRAEAALNAVDDDSDPTDPGDKADPGDTGDPGDPGDPQKDPEPQPWEPGSAGAKPTGGQPVLHDGQSVKDEDPEPQPWKPRASTEGQDGSSTTSSTKPH